MNKYDSMRNTRKKYCTQSMIYSIFLGIFFLLLGRKDICRGIILGSIFSILNFVLISQSLYKKMEKTKTKATILAISNISIRYIFMAIPLFIALRFDRFNIYGAVMGLFFVQITILLNHIPRFFHQNVS